MLRVPDWFRDRTVRKVAKFGVPAALGKFVNAISGLVTLAIVSRYLGPGPFGVIAVFRSVVTIVDLYANFNTWQAIIRYGTEALANERPRDLERVVKLAFVIDLTTAIIGASVVAGLAFIIPGRFGWTSHEAALCACYGLTLVSKVSGTADGIFRVCDAYRAQAIIAGFSSVLMTGLVALVVALGGSFDACVFALIAGEIGSNLATTATAMWVAKRSGYGGWLRSSIRGLRATFPGIARFLLATNAQLTVRTSQSELDMIIVGSMLGKVAAGLFRVVKQIGTIPGRIFLPFEMVLFTELARCSANRDYVGFRQLLRRAVAITGLGSLAVWVVAALAARSLLEIIAGSEYTIVAPALRWYLLAMVVQVASTPVLRAMVALGRPGTLFIFDAASLVVLVAAAIVGVNVWGLEGIACALLVHRSIQMIWSTSFVWRFLRRAELEGASAT